MVSASSHDTFPYFPLSYFFMVSFMEKVLDTKRKSNLVCWMNEWMNNYHRVTFPIHWLNGGAYQASVAVCLLMTSTFTPPAPISFLYLRHGCATSDCSSFPVSIQSQPARSDLSNLPPDLLHFQNSSTLFSHTNPRSECHPWFHPTGHQVLLVSTFLYALLSLQPFLLNQVYFYWSSHYSSLRCPQSPPISVFAKDVSRQEFSEMFV